MVRVDSVVRRRRRGSILLRDADTSIYSISLTRTIRARQRVMNKLMCTKHNEPDQECEVSTDPVLTPSSLDPNFSSDAGVVPSEHRQLTATRSSDQSKLGVPKPCRSGGGLWLSRLRNNNDAGEEPTAAPTTLSANCPGTSVRHEDPTGVAVTRDFSRFYPRCPGT